MSIKINYSSKKISKLLANIILFSNENFKLENLKQHLLESEFSYIKDLLKSSDLKKNLFIFEVNSKKKLY